MVYGACMVHGSRVKTDGDWARTVVSYPKAAFASRPLAVTDRLTFWSLPIDFETEWGDATPSLSRVLCRCKGDGSATDITRSTGWQKGAHKRS